MSFIQKCIIVVLIILNFVLVGLLVTKLLKQDNEPVETPDASVLENNGTDNSSQSVNCGDNKDMPESACESFLQLQQGAEPEVWASDELIKSLKKSRITREDFLPESKKLAIIDNSWSTTVMKSFGVDGTVCAEADGSVFAIGYYKKSEAWKIVTAMLAYDKNSSEKPIYRNLCPAI